MAASPKSDFQNNSGAIDKNDRIRSPLVRHFAFEIARTDHKYAEVTYDLDEKRFGEVQRIVHIVFCAQG